MEIDDLVGVQKFRENFKGFVSPVIVIYVKGCREVYDDNLECCEDDFCEVHEIDAELLNQLVNAVQGNVKKKSFWGESSKNSNKNTNVKNKSEKNSKVL
jgi:hypothetical protein